MQTTITTSVSFNGVGLHSGRPVRMTVHPASAEYGIWFKRIDRVQGDPMIPARWDAVTPSRLCTLIRNESGVEVSTVEHIMAALAGCGIHNALIEIDGPEVPILDGSAARFVNGLIRARVRKLNAPVRAIEILKPVEVHNGDAWARMEPSDTLEIEFEIAFNDAAIGHQRKHMSLANGTFIRELADSRTFCRQDDVNEMQAAGLALGGTYENAVVVDGDRVLSPSGLRHDDEAVRHKILDALGDLALAGAPILGRYHGHKAGHALTNQLLRAVFGDPQAWRLVTCDEDMASRLPGVGVHAGDLPMSA